MQFHTQPEEQGLKLELLWCAPAGTYDVKNVEDLTPHAPETLGAGNVYEIAIMVTNDTDEPVFDQWGAGYNVVLPRVIELTGEIHVELQGNNTDEFMEMRAGLEANEPLALVYVDGSNYHVWSNMSGDKAGFIWGTGSRLLEEDNIILQDSSQLLLPHTYQIIAFRVETCPLAEWEEFTSAMQEEPVTIQIAEVTEGTRWSSNHYLGVVCTDFMDIDCIISIPRWLRDLTTKDEGWWRFMIQPYLEGSTIGVNLRIENDSCAYVVTTDWIGLECDTSNWHARRYFKGATADGYDTYNSYVWSENWYGYDGYYPWVSLVEAKWGNMLEQDEVHVVLEMEKK